MSAVEVLFSVQLIYLGPFWIFIEIYLNYLWDVKYLLQYLLTS